MQYAGGARVGPQRPPLRPAVDPLRLQVLWRLRVCGGVWVTVAVALPACGRRGAVASVVVVVLGGEEVDSRSEHLQDRTAALGVHVSPCPARHRHMYLRPRPRLRLRRQMCLRLFWPPALAGR